MARPGPLQLAGYAAWFSVSFVVGVYLTFPLDGVKGVIINALEEALGKGKQGPYGKDPQVQLGHLSLSGFGVEADGVQLQLASRDPDPGPTITLDSLSVGVRPWTLLSRAKTVSVEAELYGGDVSALVSVDDKGGVHDADVEIDGLDLGRMGLAQEKLGVPMAGTLDVDAELDLGDNPEKDGSGTVTLKLAGLGVGPGNLKLAAAFGGFELPTIEMGTLAGKVVVKQGKGTLEEVKLDGKDFQAELLGEVLLKQNLAMSRLDIDGWFMPSPAFLDREPKFKSLLQLAESFGGGVLSKARDSEGHYWFSAKGNAGSPSWMLSRDAGRRMKGKGAKAGAPAAAPDPREARRAKRDAARGAAVEPRDASRSADKPAADGAGAEARPAEPKAPEVRPPEEGTADGTPPPEKPPEEKPAEEKPAEDQPAEE